MARRTRSRRRWSPVKLVSIVLAGALLVGIVLAAVAPGTTSGPSTTTTTGGVPSVTISADPETNVRNACIDWAAIGSGSTDGSITPAQVSAALTEMTGLANAAASTNPSAYGAFAQSVRDMASAFAAQDSAAVSTSIAAINPVCSVQH